MNLTLDLASEIFNYLHRNNKPLAKKFWDAAGKDNGWSQPERKPRSTQEYSIPSAAPQELTLCAIRLRDNVLLATFGNGQLFAARLIENTHGEESRGMLEIHNGKHYRASVQPWRNRKGQRVYRISYAALADRGNWHTITRPTQRSAEDLLVKMSKAGKIAIAGEIIPMHTVKAYRPDGSLDQRFVTRHADFEAANRKASKLFVQFQKYTLEALGCAVTIEDERGKEVIRMEIE